MFDCLSQEPTSFECLSLCVPGEEESKTRELLRALGDLWAVHPREKIVVFTTYLGSVDSLSSEEGLEQDFNSLDAQRKACEAFIASQPARQLHA